jgi:hypothetical protein
MRRGPILITAGDFARLREARILHEMAREDCLLFSVLDRAVQNGARWTKSLSSGPVTGSRYEPLPV